MNSSKLYFINKQFNKMSFSNAILNRSVFLDCTFSECDLSNVRLDLSTIESCLFIKSNFTGLDFGLKILEGHTKIVSSVAFSPDGKFIASGSDDKTIRIWSLANGKET